MHYSLMSLRYNIYSIYILVLHVSIPQDHPQELIQN
jgi:hypothetical protein